MFDLHRDETLSDMRAMGLLSKHNQGPSLTEHMRTLLGRGEPAKIRIATSALRRDLTSSNTGGYLIGERQGPFESIVNRWSVLRDSGLQIVSGLTENVVIPRMTTKPSGGWLGTDGVEVTESQPVIGQKSLMAKFWAVKVDVSRQLMQQSAAETLVPLIVEDAAAVAIDAAILNGAGHSGEPHGILNTADIGTQSGTSLGAAGLAAMRATVLASGARETNLRFVGAIDVQQTLAGRAFATEGPPLWHEGKLFGIPAVATASMPTGALLLGDFSRVLVGIFDGHGAGLEFNPFDDFTTGRVSFRVIVGIDVVAAPAAAFCAATSVT